MELEDYDERITSFDDYQYEISKIDYAKSPNSLMKTKMILDSCNKATKIIDCIKKYTENDNEFTKGLITDKLGDLQQYIAHICNILEIRLSEVTIRNIMKLDICLLNEMLGGK